MLQRIGFPALTVFVATMLAGCIADYKLFAEDQPAWAPDFSAPCSYRWAADRSLYRAVDSGGFGWGDSDKHGQSGLLPYLKEIASKCADQAPRNAPDAHVSAFNVEYVNRDNRKTMTVPAGFAQMITLGTAPIGMSNYFAVCIEARLPDGERRMAMARGTLESVTNVWGAMEGPMHPGNTLKRKNREQLLMHLTQQSWNKLWAAGETLPGNAACRDTLDALAKMQPPTLTRTHP